MSDVGKPIARPTPEFLIWAIERRCDLRDIDGFEQPERTDRQLRAVRAVSDARRQGRLLNGICIATSVADAAIPSHTAGAAFSANDERGPAAAQGFRVDDALSLFDGGELIQQNCGSCPANAELAHNPASWAGCYGFVPLTQPAAFHQAFAAAIDGAGMRSAWARHFESTAPEWYGAWLTSPLSAERADVLRNVVNKLAVGARVILPTAAPAIAALQRGLSTAVEQRLPFHATVYPSGEVVGRWWTLSLACPRCQATLGAEVSVCSVCGWTGKLGTAAKRRARGARPYRPLAELMPESDLGPFLARYGQQRAQIDPGC